MRIIALAVLLAFGSSAMATSVPPAKHVPKPQPPVTQPTTNTNTAIGNGGYATGGAGGSSVAGAQASGGTAVTGPVTAGNSLAIEMKGAAYAPDVISYPTAPCRVSIGASGGWFGGAIGFSGSSLDEACSRIETSRHLHNLGHQAAAVQIMCLSSEARQALEVTGVKCMIAPEKPAEPVKP
jgi:hypothetical protein